MGLTATEDVGRSVAVGWQHPMVEIRQEKEKRIVEGRIRWNDLGPSDLDTWTVQIQSEDRNWQGEKKDAMEIADAIERWSSI